MKPLLDRREWPKLAVYDIESTQWTNVVLICHTDELGNRVHFKSVGEYLGWLFEHFESDHIWAHWGGHYDHRFLIHYATVNRWEWETVLSGNTLVVVTIRHPEGREMHFCESARLMPDSAERIGKTVGLEKLDVDRSHIENLSWDETVRYCYRDCDVILRGLQYLRKALTDVGADFGYTLASIASRWVRRSPNIQWHRFYTQTSKAERDAGIKKEMDPRYLQADEFCEPAYFGGRVEVFKRGKFDGPLYYYDIRSSYPWSMLDELPLYIKGQHLEGGFRPPPKRKCDWFRKPGVSEATVTVPTDTHIPLLCVRHEGRLVFPVGVLRGRWTHLELKAALERGYDVQVHGQCVFQSKPFLKPFVDTFFGLRQQAIEEGDKFRSYAYKICLNSLYGKLVEQVQRRSIIYGKRNVARALAKYGRLDEDADLDVQSYVTRTETPGVYAVVTHQEGAFRHVAAGAYVTARSRLRLAEGLELALRMGGQVYYCDTDSIVTDVKLPEDHAIMGDVLGSYKLEATFKWAEFVSPKVYRAETMDGEHMFKCKGVPIRPKGFTVEQARERFESYCAGIGIEKEGLAGFATDIRRGTTQPRAENLVRAMRSQDRKRTHDGEHSKPLVLNMAR